MEREERVRKRVDSRVNQAEWIPVRHKSKPLRGTRRSVFDRLGKSSQDLGSSQAETFFFRNVPRNADERRLWAKFKEVGDMVDVFIPRKRDKMGQIFGFVRFRMNETGEAGVVLQKLNDIWMGSYRLRAFFPKYERTQVSNKVNTHPADRKGYADMKRGESERVLAGSNLRREGVSFKDACEDSRLDNPRGKEVIPTVNFST